MRPDRSIVLIVLLSLLAAPAIAAQRAPARKATPPAEAGRPLTADDLGGLAFRSIGPANMGGRIAAIAVVPGSRTSYYVGFATGGVFKTENLGVTWKPLFDEQRGLSIGAIAVARVKAADGEREVVWVGTGEGNGRNSSSWGHGVYRSEDGGATWTSLGLAATHDIPALALDPRDPDVAYVAALGHLWGPNAERGVYKSSDAGKSWQQVLKVDADTGACDVVLDPQNSDVVYAAMYARRRTPWSFSGNSERGGIFRSDDAGSTFKKLGGGLPARTGRIGLAVSALDSRVVYATVESDVGGSGRDPFDDRSPSGGLFRSDDRGESWTRSSPLSFRPFYFSRLALDPQDANRVYLLGWDVAISDDGGRTFRRSGSENVHVDHHAIVVNPLDPRQIVIGNDGGLYVSHDRAQTWDYRNNVAAGQFYRLAVDLSDPYRVGGGLQDNGTWIGPSETLLLTDDESKDGILNEDWRMIMGWDGYGLAFDPLDPNIVYATGQGAVLSRIRLDTQVRKAIRPVPREGQERFRFNWDSPFLISAHDPSLLYLGGNRLFKLLQRGDFWEAISPDLSRREVDKIQTVGSDAETYGTVTALAESPRRAGLLWAGTDDGRLHLTRDDGATWSDVTPPASGGFTFTSIAASVHADETAYASVSGHRWDDFRPIVVRTDDGGKSWQAASGDLPADEPVKVVIEDPGGRDVLYCGTEFGLYVTLDRGSTWVRMNAKSLPPAIVDDLVVHPRDRDLVVATHGRSLFVLDDASMFAQLTPAARAKPLALLEPLPSTPRLTGRRAYGAGHGVFRAKNPPPGATLNFWVRDAAGEPVTITIADAAGQEVRKLEATSRRGLNRVVWDLQADKKHRFASPEEADPYFQIDFVPAGEYRVTVTLGREEATATLTVRPAPGRLAP